MLKKFWKGIMKLTFFSLSNKYFSFVKCICLLFLWSWPSGMTMHVFFITYRAGHNRFMVSWTILHRSRHYPYNLVGQDSFSRTSGPLFYSKYTPLSLQLLSKAGNQKKRPESSSASLVHSTINHHSSNRKSLSVLVGVIGSWNSCCRGI